MNNNSCLELKLPNIDAGNKLFCMEIKIEHNLVDVFELNMLTRVISYSDNREVLNDLSFDETYKNINIETFFNKLYSTIQDYVNNLNITPEAYDEYIRKVDNIFINDAILLHLRRMGEEAI